MGGSSGIALIDAINPAHQDPNAGPTIGNLVSGAGESLSNPDNQRGIAIVGAATLGGMALTGTGLFAAEGATAGAGAYDAATYSGTLAPGADYAALGVGADSSATVVLDSSVAAGAPYSSGVLGVDTSFGAAGVGSSGIGVGTASAQAASSTGGFWSTLGTGVATGVGAAVPGLLMGALTPKQQAAQPAHVQSPSTPSMGVPGLPGPVGASSGGTGGGQPASKTSLASLAGNPGVLLLGAAGLIYYFKKMRR